MLPTPPTGAIAKIMLFVVIAVAVVAAFTALWPIFLGAGVLYVIQRIWSAWIVSKQSPEEKAAAFQAALIERDKQREAEKALQAVQDASRPKGYFDKY
jgi:uncharacterized membrane protein YqjE